MIGAIFAVDEEGGLGKDGTIPWPYNKEDMGWFKHITTGSVVVMGKRSWNSPDMVKPLPNRVNAVLTNEPVLEQGVHTLTGDACQAVKDIAESYADLNTFVIGGANVLEQTKPVLERIYMTRIPGKYNCDTVLDVDKFLQGFHLVDKQEFKSCCVVIYERV